MRLWIAFVVLSYACTPPLPPEPPVIAIDTDGSRYIPAACANLVTLGCSDVRTQAEVETCTRVWSSLNDEQAVDLHPRCVADAKTLEEAKRCGVRCK